LVLVGLSVSITGKVTSNLCNHRADFFNETSSILKSDLETVDKEIQAIKGLISDYEIEITNLSSYIEENQSGFFRFFKKGRIEESSVKIKEYQELSAKLDSKLSGLLSRKENIEIELSYVEEKSRLWKSRGERFRKLVII
jgi:predicted  nucleic acid-binding Zn-ribbon protein